MLDALPNLRGALLLFSGFFALFSLAAVWFTVRSKNIQAGKFLFSDGQYASTVALFCFGLIFAFAYSLPGPAAAARTPQQVRADLAQDYYDECDANYGERLDARQQQNCVDVARYRADTELGYRTPTRVIRLKPQPLRTVWRTRTINHVAGQEARRDAYKNFNEKCVYNAGGRNTTGYASVREMQECAQIARQQTDAAYDGKHVATEVTQ